MTRRAVRRLSRLAAALSFQERRARNEVAATGVSLQQARQQLEELKTMRTEYRQHQAARGEQGTPSRAFNEFRRFMSDISHLVEAQEAEVFRLQQIMDKHRSTFLQRQRQRETGESLLVDQVRRLQRRR